jgi:hypothetical protein
MTNEFTASVLNSFLQYVFSDGKMNIERLTQLVKLVGKQRLILDLSCRKKVHNLSCVQTLKHVNALNALMFSGHGLLPLVIQA